MEFSSGLVMKRVTFRHISKIDFDLRQLEIFSKVVELGSFSKAAEVVFLAQASVSERIATLENLVGTRLLDRLGRKVVPTKAGELLYKHAVLLLDMKMTACLEMEHFLGLKQGEIQMGASTIPGEYILPKVMGGFHQKYPFVSISLAISDTKGIQNQVIEGRLDLGVVGSKSPHKDLIHHELWQDELVLAIPRDHRWAPMEEVPPAELFEEPFVLRESGSGTLKIMEDYLRQSAARDPDALRVVARLGSSTAVKEGVRAGLGISILSSRAIEGEVQMGTIRALKIKGLPMSRSFYLIRDKRRIASPLCKAMVDFLLTTINHPDFSAPMGPSNP